MIPSQKPERKAACRGKEIPNPTHTGTRATRLMKRSRADSPFGNPRLGPVTPAEEMQ